ncbi:hypothetical protein [Granulicella sp. S190]|uniref:hypothetical protein n=1 Tax=Granulicella sp. S190 TaxID=1747226 RepID=UPI00131B740C|nr:hypothetical protein [Granulicella sp. S190]
MARTTTESLSGILAIAMALTVTARALAQENGAASSTPQAVLSAQTTDAAQPTSQPADIAATDHSILDPKAAPSSPALQPASLAKGKKGKQEYTGPTTLVELPPAPMLDEEGNQRQDPDGKLMFNPPIKQQRDKFGHPFFDEHGKPVMQTKDNLGYDENGKKLHPSKEKPPKTVSVSITRGTLTIDGMTGKAALNYEIKDLKYVYFYIPGIGITVVSNASFPGAVEQKKAFDDKTLTVTVGEHIVQLTSDQRLLSKVPESAFVRVDKSFSVPTKFPVMGYGPIRVAPYAWPGSKQNEDLKGAVEAPPLPVDLRPEPLMQACPTGQMRMPGATVLPGQAAAPRPCVPIAATQPTATTGPGQVAMGRQQSSK